MQNRHLYSLLDTTYTTVKVQFHRARTMERDDTDERVVKRGRVAVGFNEDILDSGFTRSAYIYKAPREMELKVDDAVIVESPSHGLVVVRVVEVHDQPQIDLDAQFEYKWIVQRVDRTFYDAQVEKEKRFNQMMLEVERVNQREKLMQDMRNNLPEGSAARTLFDQATNLLRAPETVSQPWSQDIQQPAEPQSPAQPGPYSGHIDVKNR